MTTVKNVEADQIRRLSGEAGDPEQAALCEAALDYLRRDTGAPGYLALRKCVAAINAAEAQA